MEAATAPPETVPPVQLGRARRRPPTWTRLFRQALRYRRTQIGLGLTGATVVLAVVGPLLATHHPGDFVAPPFSPPGPGYPLGTDYIGGDVVSRVLWGGRSVIWMSLAAATLGVAGGVLVGLVAGYSRNWVGGLLMRAMDVLLAFPYIVLVLLFVSMVGPKLWLIVLLVALVWVPQVARVTQGITQGVMQQDFVDAAAALGLPRRHILLREVLPNLSTPLMVEYGLRLTWSIALIAAISFLGFGIQPPNSDWGLMLNQNRNGLVLQPWAVVLPVICISVFTVGTNLVTEGLSRALARIDAASSR